MKIVELKHANVKNLAGEIKKGKIIVSLTDTVYGLICDAGNKRAVGRIFKIKKRSLQKPLSVFVKDFKTARKIAVINNEQEKILKAMWPGKLIAVFKARKKFPQGIVCESGKIGLRIPDYKLLQGILSEFKKPLAQTSANISGEPAPSRIKGIIKQFTLRRGSGQEKNQPDLIIDAGNLKKSKPSKVVDLTGDTPKILRRR